MAVAGDGIARDGDGFLPVRDLYVSHKEKVLDLEARLRGAPDTALTGLPGFAVLLLACDGEGCVGRHRVRLSGGDAGKAPDEWLQDAFPKGGWVPLAVAGNGKPVTLSWQTGDEVHEVAFTLPPAGAVTVVDHLGREVVVSTIGDPGPDLAWRVALAEHARGDRLAALATLRAAEELHGTLPGSMNLLSGDLAREAGLVDQAEARYRGLLNAPDPFLGIRARIGLARVALGRNHPQDAIDVLEPVQLAPEHPLSGAVIDLNTRAYLAMDMGRTATEAFSGSGSDPFAAVNRAMAFQSVGDTFSAIGELKSASRLSNRSVPVEAYLRERVLLSLGTLYGEQGRMDAAMVAFSKMSPQGPLGDRYRFSRGLAFFNNRELVKAVAEFDALDREWPGSLYALEGHLAKAEAYRRLNAPRQAVAVYREALERFQERTRRIDRLLAEVRRQPFQSGLTGAAFAADWRERAAVEPPELSTGLQILFGSERIAPVLAEHRQITLTLERLETLNRRFAAAGHAQAAEVSGGIEGLGVFRTLFEEAARQEVIRILGDERQRVDDLSVAASLGITQSVLFDQRGQGGKGLVFEAAP